MCKLIACLLPKFPRLPSEMDSRRVSAVEETKRERKEGDAPMNEVAKKFRFSRGSLGAASMGRGPGTFRNRAPLPSQDGFYLSV